MAANRGCIEYRLDPTPNAGSCLWLLRPDRIEHPQHQASVDRADRQFPQSGVDVRRQCYAPLLAVLGIAPRSLVAGDIFLGGFAKCATLGRGDSLRLSVSYLGLERVNPILNLFSMIHRTPPRIRERQSR